MPASTGTQDIRCTSQRGVMEAICGTVLVAFARVRAALSLTDIDRDGGFTAVVIQRLLSAPEKQARFRAWEAGAFSTPERQARLMGGEIVDGDVRGRTP